MEEEESERNEEEGGEDDLPFVQHDRLIDLSALTFDLCLWSLHPLFKLYCRGFKMKLSLSHSFNMVVE